MTFKYLNHKTVIKSKEQMKMEQMNKVNMGETHQNYRCPKGIWSMLCFLAVTYALVTPSPPNTLFLGSKITVISLWPLFQKKLCR